MSSERGVFFFFLRMSMLDGYQITFRYMHCVRRGIRECFFLVSLR